MTPRTISSAARRAVRALRREDGFTMPVLMAVLLAAMLFVFVALGAADGDTSEAREDQDRKQAYAAAEAAINEYLFHLDQDNSYWSHCTNVPAPAPISQRWNGSGSDPREWRGLPGTEASYTIELIPANGNPQCDEANAQQTMIDATTGTFQIRATGDSRGVRRSIIATFKKKSFLDYLYFTDYETRDPVFEDTQAEINWATANCVKYYRQGRPNGCVEIQFADQDVIAGALHTNDELLICGTPTFGRNAQDAVEVSAPPRGWRGSGFCNGNQPDFQGTWKPSSPILALPPSNGALSTIADPAYRFTGRTTIVLNGSNMTVNGNNMALPANGVIYVRNGSCTSSAYNWADPYNTQAGCAEVWLRGSYSRDLTIASDRDIIVNGDVTRNGDVTLGLIPNNFVRVYHPVSSNCQNNLSGTMQNVTIEAAILTLQHSFTVDNYRCGPRLGTLTVNGVIAQKFRGPVGTGGGLGGGTGYTKAYGYDDRFHHRTPPYFLNPVSIAWRVARHREQVPAR